MKFHRDNSGRLVVSLAKGESIRESIESLARGENILGAKLTAIGAVDNPEIGFYHLHRREYDRKRLNGEFELLSLIGNISVKEGAPFLHAHVTLGDANYAVFGGHLFDAEVAVVVEMFIEPLADPLPRQHHEPIGLPRWEPGR